MKYRVTNWAEYDAGLRRRGSLTLWVSISAVIFPVSTKISKLEKSA
jgi:hypothetical protein